MKKYDRNPFVLMPSLDIFGKREKTNDLSAKMDVGLLQLYFSLCSVIYYV